MRSKLVVIAGLLTIPLICLMPAVLVFSGFAKEVGSQQELSRGRAGTPGPFIRTDRVGYLAGQPVTISGSSFSPFESVMLRVTHTGGTSENGMGHEAWWVNADAGGTFTTQWTMVSADTAGVNLTVEAAGSFGSNAQADFVRTGSITIDRFSNRPGEAAQIRGAGFAPNELVNIEIKGAHSHSPLTMLSDEKGKIAADLMLPDEPEARSFAVEAAAPGSGVVALTVINSNWFVVPDTAGANDQPGQVDLTQMGRSDDDPNFFKLLWSWDSTSAWTGTGQTGDACALYDTDNDGNINYAVCIRVANPNANPAIVNILPAASNKPAYLWQCSDGKNDRCTQPTALTGSYTAGQILAGPWNNATVSGAGNLILDADPFAAGEGYPNDTTVEVRINKNVIPAPRVLVNVCSYPSAGSGGNNNPFDCILTPGDGLLKITKNVVPATTQGTFTFTVSSPAPSIPQPSSYTLTTVAGTASQTNIGMHPTTTGKITETIPTGWELSTAACTLEGGVDDPITVTTATGEVGGIEIQTGKLTTCVLTNSRAHGTLTVIKHVINDNGGTGVAGDFRYTIGDNSSATNESGAESPGKSYARADGTSYKVQENPPTGYDVSYAGDCEGTIVAGVTKVCTITNNDQPATLIVKKVLTNDNGGTKTASDFSFQVNGGSAIPFESDGQNNLTLNAGTYSVTELAVNGYSTTYDNCSNIVLANGGSATCTVTNNDQPATLIVKKVVTNDNGGTKTASDFSFQVNGGPAIAFESDGQNDLTLNAGTYSVTELAVSGYSTTYNNCSNIVLANGGSATCTVTNNDDVATLVPKISQSWVVYSSLELPGYKDPAPNFTRGSVDFKLYSDANCTIQVGSMETKIIDGQGKASTSNGVVVPGPGTYLWRAFFGGDQFNGPVSTPCGQESSTITDP